MWFWLLACGGADPSPANDEGRDDALAAALDRIEALEAEVQGLAAALDGQREALDAQAEVLATQGAVLDAQGEALDAQGAAIDAFVVPAAACDIREATGTCWSDPGCVAAGVCSVRRVFVTSRDYSPNVGDGDPLRVADDRCQVLAAGAGLGGRWRAWLGVAGDAWSAPVLRFTPYDGPFERVDGVRVADSPADLLDGTLQAGIEVDELGQLQTGTVWTAVAADGATVPFSDEQTCADWAFDGWGYGYGPTYRTDRGVVGAVDAAWTATGTLGSCLSDARMYCFEQ